MLQDSLFKYKAYMEGNWNYLIEEKMFSKAFYLRKSEYGAFMLMFELLITDIKDDKDMINKNKAVFKCLYNALYCKGEE